MRRLTELLESVHQAIDPMQMMQRVCVETLSLISNAENALIGLVDDERTLTYIRGAGTRLDAVGATVQLDGSLSGRANRIGIAVYSEDTENDDRVDREACRRLNAVSLVCVPIRHGAERLGVLTVNAPMPQAFTAADVTLLTQVAEFVGAVVFTSRSLSRSTVSMFGLGDEVDDSASAGISAKARYVANILSPGSVGEALDEDAAKDRHTLAHGLHQRGDEDGGIVVEDIESVPDGAPAEPAGARTVSSRLVAPSASLSSTAGRMNARPMLGVAILAATNAGTPTMARTDGEPW